MNERSTLKVNSNGVLEIGGVTATELVKEFGTPVYVMDEHYIEDICNAYKNALDDYYGDGLICYASKAFSCKEIYRVINRLGLGADAVSEGEIYTALKSGFPLNKLVFHGNNKSKKELEFAIENKIGYIVIDAFSEADFIDQICSKLNVKQNVLIRVNPGVEAHTHEYIQTAKVDSKFGFSLSTGEAEEIIKYCKQKSNINLVGLHCHIGSQIFEKQSFILATEKMIDFYKLIKDKYSYNFDVLNMGGGFGIWYNQEDKKMSLDDYKEFIKLISQTIKEKVVKNNLKKPYLILEPGRSIVGEAGVTLYSAGNVKIIKDIKNYLAVDGGMFENPRFALYQAKYTVKLAEKMNDNSTETYTIAGKCCESGDIIAENCHLPKVMMGDILAVFSTGAYNYSMASNYNRNLIPPVVFVKDGKARYAVKPQTLDDLLRNDV